jgi:hypothetical protein
MFIIDLFEKEQFNIDAFHGTGSNFDAFEYNKNARGNSGAREAGIGFWFTNNPQTASDFAHWSSRSHEGGQVLPVKLRINHPLILDSYDKLKDIVDKYTTFAKPGYILGDRNIRMVQDKTDFEKLRHDLKSKGYDGIIIKNTLVDSPDGKTPIDQYIVFDASQIRSRFAKFDPTKKDSTNLLDGIIRESVEKIYINGKKVIVFKNPNRQQLDNIFNLNRLEEEQEKARGIISNNILYVWDAKLATHGQIRYDLGLNKTKTIELYLYPDDF